MSCVPVLIVTPESTLMCSAFTVSDAPARMRAGRDRGDCVADDGQRVPPTVAAVDARDTSAATDRKRVLVVRRAGEVLEAAERCAGDAAGARAGNRPRCVGARPVQRVVAATGRKIVGV